MTNTTKIYGPPGTGKTTRLMKAIEGAVKQGVPMDKIAFISMTRKAVNEATARAKATLEAIGKEWIEEDFASFATLHSFTTRAGGIPLDRIMAEEDYDKVRVQMAQHYPTYLKKPVAWMPSVSDADMSSLSFQDAIAARENLKFCDDLQIIHTHGITGRSIPELIEEEAILSGKQNNVSFIPSRIKRIRNLEGRMGAYKSRTSKMEFNDIITEFYMINVEFAPDFEIIFVDEAQDLDNHQWKCVKALEAKTNHMIIAGDPDQSIFRFGGADPKTFTDYEADDTIVLDRSYRIPSSHHAVAQAAIRKDVNRVDFEYKSKDEVGTIGFVSQVKRDFGVQYHVMDMQGREVLCSHRDKKVVEEARDEYINTVLATFSAQFSTEVDEETGLVSLFKGDELLYKGTAESVSNEIAAKQLKVANTVKDSCKIHVQRDIESQKHSIIASIDESLNKGESVLITSTMNIPLDEVRELLTLEGVEFAYGNNSNNDALVRVANLYKAKGGEADKVIFIDAVSEAHIRTHELYPNDIYRLYYVGLTRARKTLEILPFSAKGIHPIMNQNFEITM